jgi:hypothetical protein
MITRATDSITIWLDHGVPVHIVWRGARYKVTDKPTPLRGELDFLPDAIAHPLEPIIGWRFQGTDDDGRARMFDVLKNKEAWELVKVYD